MTKQTVFFPRTYNSLKHTFKNFYSLTKVLFGLDALLTQALAVLYNHIHQFEIQYTKCFQQNWWFGASIIDRVHVRVQMFLHSDALGNPQRINIIVLDLADFLNKIAMDEFIASQPWWLDQSEDKKCTNNTSTNPTKHPRRDRHDHHDQGNTIHLQTWEIGARLQVNEQFKQIFHVQNKQGHTPPLSHTSKPLCHPFYAIGRCSDTCKRYHETLNQQEQQLWQAFLDHCRSKYQRFSSRFQHTVRTPRNTNNTSDTTSRASSLSSSTGQTNAPVPFITVSNDSVQNGETDGN